MKRAHVSFLGDTLSEIANKVQIEYIYSLRDMPQPIASRCDNITGWHLLIITSPIYKAVDFCRITPSENVLRDFQNSLQSDASRHPCRGHGSDELDPLVPLQAAHQAANRA